MEVDVEKVVRKLACGLTIGGDGSKAALQGDGSDVSQYEGLRRRFEREGFVCVQNAIRGDVVERLREAAQSLETEGWPATFLLLFDETWSLMEAMRPLMEAIGGKSKVCNGDILAWVIDPNKGAAGFSPHRDRQPENPKESFHEDGSPKYFTCWIALSDANPDNSCLYVIPKHADPGYESGDLDDIDPLRRALDSKESYQNVRALPLAAGGAAIFTHRIIHWGSRGRADADVRPRVSLSFALAADDFEPSYLADPSVLPYPAAEVRLALACAQMIAYHDRFRPSMQMLRLCHSRFKELSHHLSESYRKKVLQEFISAAKAVGQEDGPEAGDDEELVDDVMDAMLDAEDVEDDFDNLADEDDELGQLGEEDGAADDNEEDDEDDEEEEDFDLNKAIAAQLGKRKRQEESN